jgi:hypothetical protein
MWHTSWCPLVVRLNAYNEVSASEAIRVHRRGIDHWYDQRGSVATGIRPWTTTTPYYHDTYLRQSSTGGTVYLKRGRIFKPKASDPVVYVYGQFGSSLAHRNARAGGPRNNDRESTPQPRASAVSS